MTAAEMTAAGMANAGILPIPEGDPRDSSRDHRIWSDTGYTESISNRQPWKKRRSRFATHFPHLIPKSWEGCGEALEQIRRGRCIDDATDATWGKAWRVRQRVDPLPFHERYRSLRSGSWFSIVKT